jgi:hypothetical protein
MSRSLDDPRRGIELSSRANSRGVQSDLGTFGFPLACRVVGCQACADDSTFTEVNEMQLDKMRVLLAGVGKRLSEHGSGPVCVCQHHRSTAVELIGELVAELPPSDRGSEFRVGRILDFEAQSTSTRSQPPALDSPGLDSQDSEAVPPPEATFSERFADDTVRYRVRWYDDEGAGWLEEDDQEDERPPVGFTTYDIEQVRRGLDVFVGLSAYYERCASAKAPWRILDIGELGRKARKAIFGYRIVKFFRRGTTVAKICILCFRFLVLAVAGIFFWAIWISYAKADKHLAAALSAGAISVLSTTIAMFEIISHLQNVHSPELQTYVVRILFIVPVFAIDCWLSLRFAQTDPKWIVYINACVRHARARPEQSRVDSSRPAIAQRRCDVRGTSADRVPVVRPSASRLLRPCVRRRPARATCTRRLSSTPFSSSSPHASARTARSTCAACWRRSRSRSTCSASATSCARPRWASPFCSSASTARCSL